MSDTDAITVVRSYASANCDGENEMMRLRNGFVLNSSPKRLGIPLWDYHDNAAKEFFVTANNPQIYMFEGNEHSGRSIMKCGVAIKQKFEEGKDYEVNFTMKSFSCSAKVSEMKNNESGHPEKVVLQKRNSQLTSEFSKACLAEFKKSRLW